MNPTVGDLSGNADLVIDAIRRAREANADLVILPELAITGYPPRDLLWQDGFVEEAVRQAERAAGEAGGVTAIVGCPWLDKETRRIFNSALVLRDGVIDARYAKRLLPTYDVFDEDRYFTPGDQPLVFEVAGVKVGVAICEDLWHGDDAGFGARYADQADPIAALVERGAELIASPSASPFVLGKAATQRNIVIEHARRRAVVVASVNQFGANDDLIFDGHACVAKRSSDGAASIVAANEYFTGSMLIHEFSRNAAAGAPAAEPERLLWNALTLGVRDYVRKSGFRSVLLGLSGGVDSALTACIAVAALGPENVLTIGLPSRYSSAGSVTDAQALARRIGVRFEVFSIEKLHACAEREFEPMFAKLGAPSTHGITEENVQSRLRGMLLMAISNKTGALLLTTGNKSELAVGYCTLYGDMNGGLAPLNDVTKTQIYKLARWLNNHHRDCGFTAPPIPKETLSKPPSAELRPGQTDQDSLPPYAVLDAILVGYIEDRAKPETIARTTGINPDLVRRVIRMIDLAEYKRKQTAVGLKVSRVAFGPGRRHPIAQAWQAPN